MTEIRSSSTPIAWRAEPLRPAGPPRIGTLETLREYGLARLTAANEVARLRRRHAEYYLALAETANTHLFGPAAAEWLDRLEAERDNLRAALTYFLTEPAAPATAGVPTERGWLGARLARALAYAWYLRDHYAEGLAWSQAGLAAAGAAPTPTRGWLAIFATALAVLQYRWAEAAAHADLALADFRALGDRAGEAMALNNLAGLAIGRGDLATAHRSVTEATALARTVDAPWVLAFSLHLAAYLPVANDADRRAVVDELWGLATALGDRYMLHHAGSALAQRALAEGAIGLAAAHCRSVLRGAVELRSRFFTWHTVWLCAVLATHVGRVDVAVQLFGSLPATLLPPEVAERFRTLQTAADAEPFEAVLRGTGVAAWAADRQLSLGDAVARSAALLDAISATAPAPAASP